MPRPADPGCPLCDGTGWVCEAHADRPSDCSSPDHPDACHCGAPGEPCKACYPEPARLDDPPDLRLAARWLDRRFDAS